MNKNQRELHLLEYAALSQAQAAFIPRTAIHALEQAGLLSFKGIAFDGKAVISITPAGAKALQERLTQLLC